MKEVRNRGPAAERPNPDPQVESPHDQRVLFALRRIIRAVDIYSRKLVAEHQITGPQLVCLNAVVEAGPLTATDLAHAIHLSTSTVVRILDRLEARGLIQRQRQRDDRRRVHVTATLAGHDLSVRTPYSAEHPLHLALRQLPERRRASIAALLEDLVESMDARDLSASPLPGVEVAATGGRADEVQDGSRRH